MAQIAKFDQKAVVMYGCPQIAEGISVNQNFWFPDSTTAGVIESPVLVVSGTTVRCVKAKYSATLLLEASSTKVDAATHPFKSLAIGSYLYDVTSAGSKVGAEGKGSMIGRIASIVPEKTNSVITDYVIKLEELPIERPFISGVQAASTGNLVAAKFRSGLGPKNALAALNLKASIETQSETFQYTGDELSRDEVTIITDRTCKFEFETFLPIFGTIENTVDLGFKITKIAASTTDDDNITTTIVSLNVVDENSPHSLSSIIEAIPLNSTLNYTDTASGVSTELGVITGKVSSGIGGNAFTLTVKVDSTIQEDITPTVHYPAFLTIKENALSIPISPFFQACGMALVLNNAASRYTISNKHISNTYLTAEFHHASGDLRTKNKVYTMTDCRGSADLDMAIGSIPKLKFNFEGNVNQAKVASEKNKLFPDFGKQKQTRSVTLKASSIVYAALEEYDGTEAGIPTTIPTGSNIVFNKITAPAMSGYKYERLLTSDIEGWSKGGEASDLTISILEDVSSDLSVFDPHDNLEKYYKFSLLIKKNVNEPSIGSKVLVVFDKIQLTKVGSGTIGSYISQEVTFRNVDNVSFTFS